MDLILHTNLESSELEARRNRVRNRHEGLVYQRRSMEGTMRHILSDPVLVPSRAKKPKDAKHRFLRARSDNFRLASSRRDFVVRYGSSKRAEGSQKKNFTQENIKRIRQISVQRQLSEQNKGRSLAATWTASKTDRPAPERQSFTRVTRESRRTLPQRPASAQIVLTDTAGSHPPPGRQTRDRSVPRRSTSESRPQKRPNCSTAVPAKANEVPARDIVRSNAVAASKALAVRARSASAGPNKKEARGRSQSASRPASVKSGPPAKISKLKSGELPEYLKQRRQEWKQVEDAAKAAAEKPKLPPGCYIMPDGERSSLLQQLQESKKTKEREIFLLPLRSDTLRAQRKRQELEAAVTEIEEGLYILSKPIVVVQGSEKENTPVQKENTVSTKSKKPTAKPVEKARPVWNQGAVDGNKLYSSKQSALPPKERASSAKQITVKPFGPDKGTYKARPKSIQFTIPGN